jgi:hypothetical protein
LPRGTMARLATVPWDQPWGGAFGGDCDLALAMKPAGEHTGGELVTGAAAIAPPDERAF